MDRLRTSSSRQPRVELVTRTLPRFPNRRAWCAGCSWVPLPAVCVLPVAVVGLPLSNCRQRWQSGGWRISSAARFAALGSNADRAQRLLIGWPVDWVAPIGCFGGGRQFVLASTSGRIACLQNHPLEELPGRITRSNYQVELPGRITRSNYQVGLPGHSVVDAGTHCLFLGTRQVAGAFQPAHDFGPRVEVELTENAAHLCPNRIRAAEQRAAEFLIAGIAAVHPEDDI